ncbi:DUF3089 domain-containing protein [Altererythrobacter sp. SALINAS58]|uniref:DUF3089 domain-containing protein n=1 Tax=Alteripontixanthobacter muriae TaxID=2705546 RepID=UPI001575C43E|nr:DUF3089 domain-containing protein [Alteripontixanthobacter muriae]NTZ42515.1 DUF3089 domain-containing protein [Alteripontixanthobacter muriae]
MARKFLYLIAILIVLAIAGAFALAIWGKELQKMAFVPGGEFVEQERLADNAYQSTDMWISRPGIGIDDPARWQPATRGEAREVPVVDEGNPEFAVFFVHPTSFIERTSWNAALDDAQSGRIAEVYVRGMASPFNQASEIWAPKYRQATFGAFLTDTPDAEAAIDTAYEDVAQAFAFFIDSIAADTPIVLVGHSQGALHLMSLLQQEIAGTALEDRIAAAYLVGWPISVAHDLPALGLPACATAGQANCIASWSSYAEPADPSALIETYSESRGLDGTLRGDSSIVCTNPISGTANGTAPASANLGTLVPDTDLTDGELVPQYVPARCDERGLLLIGAPPEMGAAVLPGNNYHVYDIPLFWRNLQRDVAQRVESWTNRPR